MIKKRLKQESFYQEKWCIGGRTEVKLDDDMSLPVRCDCLTKTHAIEFDFADKWAEALGQALYYSYLTGRKAGIYLIIESFDDLGYLKRLTDTISANKLSVDIWTVHQNSIRPVKRTYD